MKNFKRYIISIVIALSGLFFLTGCTSKADIDNMLKDADYTLHEGKYDEARAIYKEILSIDNDNRDALYGLKDLEKVCANKDYALMDTLNTEIAAAVFYPDNKAKEVPFGDYSLDEYLNLAGDGVKSAVYSMMGVSSSQDISNKLLSTDKEGNPIKGKEIRVGYYDKNTWSVYIPGSYDIGREEIIFGGVRPQ